MIEKLGGPDYFKGNETYCLKTLSKNDENLLLDNAKNYKKINELIKAVKQLDRKINEPKCENIERVIGEIDTDEIIKKIREGK